MTKDQVDWFSCSGGYDTELRPVLKWAGGKRRLIPSILSKKPEFFTRYIEPFAGALAICLSLKPPVTIINDINSEIVNVYEVIRNDIYGLVLKLREHQSKDSEEYYYKIREMDRLSTFKDVSPIEKAARTIYLNKTCFNGLYRLNSKGYFNVPRGDSKIKNLFDFKNIMGIFSYFRDNEVILRSEDFEKVLDYAYEGDFIYLDPPYDVINKTSFVSYFDAGFDKEDQIRLFKKFEEMDFKGCKIILSNASTPFILDLYKKYRIEFVDAPRFINSIGSGRKKITEVLILNY